MAGAHSGIRVILYVAMLSIVPVSSLAQDRDVVVAEFEAPDFGQMEAEILVSTSEEERSKLLDRFLLFMGSDEHFPEFATVSERLIPLLPEAAADRLAYGLSVAQERLLGLDFARETVELRQLNGGGADTEWGFLLRYRNALLATKQGDYGTAANLFEFLYNLGDDVIPENQAGRIRRQLTDTYRQLGRWEDVVRMGEEARVFTSDEDEKILGLLYHLGTAYSAMGEFDAAARMLNELTERVNHFYPDETSRRTGAALAYAGVEEWAVRAQTVADTHADANNGPVRVAVIDSLEKLREKMEADDGGDDATPVTGEVAPEESATDFISVTDDASVSNAAQEGSHRIATEQHPSGGVWRIRSLVAAVLLVGGAILILKRCRARTASTSRTGPA